MIFYWLINFLISLVNFGFSLFPIFETPTWLITNLPQIFNMVFAFNQYLPIVEAFNVVVFLIIFSMSYKLYKIVLNRTGIDLNS